MSITPSKQNPLYHGTIFVDRNIMTDERPTTYLDITPLGTKSSIKMWDRRVNQWLQNEAHCFKVTFTDCEPIEFQVNIEFSPQQALAESAFYAIQYGRMPTYLKSSVQTFWIMKGTQGYGGGNNNVMVHTGQTLSYLKDGIILETFLHEGSHASLDHLIKDTKNWLDAQKADNGNFISTYALDNPTREDIAETFVIWWALRKSTTTTLTKEQKQKIENQIPNRLDFFDNLEKSASWFVDKVGI